MSTKIEWADETWPVVTGCTPVSEGCRNCFAARMAATRLKHHPRYEGLATIENGKARWVGEVRLNHDVLEQPLHWKKPRMIFVASMGDLFHKDVPDDFLIEVFVRMGEAHHHIYQLLTKRPDRMFDFISKSTWGVTPLSNVCLGTSVENQAAADERIPWLLRTPAAVHYVSTEPMLEPVDMSPYLPQVCAVHNCVHRNGRDCLRPRDNQPIRLDWVICGGESGPGARPMHPDWARSLRDQCQAAGTPYFFKQHGAWLHRSQLGGEVGFPKATDMHCWTSNLDASYRVGKKRAGNLLDGREHQEFPGRKRC